MGKVNALYQDIREGEAEKYRLDNGCTEEEAWDATEDWAIQRMASIMEDIGDMQYQQRKDDKHE